MEKNLDLSFASEYDLSVDKDRDLDASIHAVYLSGCTEYNYDFTLYTGATLTVKNSSGTIVQTFDTDDGSIVLGLGGIFTLIKTAAQMDTVRAGCYRYDMYLRSSTYAKRAFLTGEITYIQNISN